MHITYLDIHHLPTAQRLLTIQRAAYAIEAALIGSTHIPPLHETLEALQQSRETFYGCQMDEEIAGFISYVYEDTTLDIYRMAIHPAYFRRGIASALLSHVEQCEPQAARVIVSTGARNEPACQLYLRHGFHHIGDREVEPGLVVSLFEKAL